jgi:phosphoribosylamine--glycine ligase
MGAVSPVPFADEIFMEKVIEKVVKPTIDGLYKEGLVYKGFVFFGLINVRGEPFVIEYNCRMGDPETEVVMPRLKSDLIDLFLKMESGGLDEVEVKLDERAAATVVLVSGGYPGDFQKGKTIKGLNEQFSTNTLVFYAGISAKGDELVTSGGRVAAITSYGNTITDAVASSIAAIDKIEFDGMAFRRDIGYEFKK